MSVNLSPIGNDAPFVDSSGNPLSGGLLYWYTANSSTPQDTYTTSAGNVANANPVVLGSTGYPTVASSVVEIWLTAGVSYKAVLKNAAGTTLWTRDNISGINDTTVTIDQWVSGPTPTYISATQFSLVGDQTSTFQVGRRVKTTNTGGTIYSIISASAYGALTTVTVVNDSGTLDAGLSAVSYGLISSTNTSLPFASPLSVVTNSLSGDVALNNTATFFTGPTIPQGTVGIWFASGTVTLTDTAVQAAFQVKLWDGTSLISSTRVKLPVIDQAMSVTLSGYISAPAGNIRISVCDLSATTGVILYNQSTLTKDSTITAIRIG